MHNFHLFNLLGIYSLFCQSCSSWKIEIIILFIIENTKLERINLRYRYTTCTVSPHSDSNCDFTSFPRIYRALFLFEFYIPCALFQEGRLASLARWASWKLHNVLASRVLELRESLELLESHESNARDRERIGRIYWINFDRSIRVLVV